MVCNLTFQIENRGMQIQL